MTTLNTIEDFLRAMRDDEEIRAAVRRELLTDELLALPERVSALMKSFEAHREATDKRFDIVVNRLDGQDETLRQQKEDTDRRFDIVVNRLDEQKEDTDRRFDIVVNRLDEQKEDTDRRFDIVVNRLDEQKEDMDRRFDIVVNRLDEQKEDMDRRFDIVVNRLDRQHEMYRRQHDDLGRFRGNYAISAARNRDGEIAGLFARLHGMGRMLQVRRLGKEERDAMLNDNLDAVESLSLSGGVWLTFPSADIIAEVRDRRNSGQGFYIAVEASYTGSIEDFLCATDNAKILRCVTGQDAYAVVAGVRMGPSAGDGIVDDIERIVAGNDENTAFWYQLEESELEPSDPC